MDDRVVLAVGRLSLAVRNRAGDHRNRHQDAVTKPGSHPLLRVAAVEDSQWRKGARRLVVAQHHGGKELDERSEDLFYFCSVSRAMGEVRTRINRLVDALVYRGV